MNLTKFIKPFDEMRNRLPFDENIKSDIVIFMEISGVSRCSTGLTAIVRY